MLTRQKTRDGRVTGFGLGLTLGEREGRPEAWHTGGQERVSNVLYLSPDRGVPGGGRSVAILTNLEGVQPELLALARSVSGLIALRRVRRPEPSLLTVPREARIR